MTTQPTSWSISQLARNHGLSRSTLLYYDRIGLLHASDRSSAGYRRYSEAEAERLRRIGTYRRAGLSLAAIGELLQTKERGLGAVLAERLEALNAEILRLRTQQRFISTLLGAGAGRLEGVAFMSRRQFVALLRSGGFTDGDMARWHASFEHQAPEQHRQFLEFLCIPDEEIARIRRRARGAR